MAISTAMKEKHPEIFAPDRNQDPRQRTRTVPMQVLSLGFCRTGTSCESPRYVRSEPLFP